jgi:Kef-type K+ transport system membrane component KefB
VEDQAVPLIVFGLLFFAGLAADRVGRRFHLPRVTLLLGFGLVVGQAGFDLLPRALTSLYPVIAVVALSAVAVLLGSALSVQNLREHGRVVLLVSLSVVVVTQLVVSTALWVMGLPLILTILLGAMATATDPAATYDVIEQSGQDTSFTRTLKGLVAIDDAWGLLAFTLALVLIEMVSGFGPGGATLADAAYEVFGSILLGCVIGVPGALLTGRLSDGEPLRIEALGLVFLTAGLSLMLGLSYLIAGMTVGAVIVNLARHHTRAFHEIRNFEWPFMIIFFVLAGATLDPAALSTVGLAGVGYLVFRVLGRVLGGLVGGWIAGAPKRQGPYFGAAMLPQAGVAIGMALAASERFPEYAASLMALAIGTTTAFELIGPIVASRTLSAQSRSTEKRQDAL